MAPNKNKNTFNLKDLAKAAEREKPKPRPSYLTWIKRGGWQSFGKASAGSLNLI